ncbi:unnamed protein product [Paramecium sonneborni]|uniref:HIT-type domain-containing protein n=1 Tax=Paramecium sonneborni TaxID=65129 RepID=A0A8S1MEL0_9CILI|nr:unnamed protein product [Paramecium sonneborni]
MMEDGEISELCKMCGKPDKYKCPQCETKTCSLDCCKKHKQIYNCNGIRDPSKQPNKITELLVQRDYNYVNNVMQNTEMIQKKLVGITALPDAMRYKLLKHYARKMNVDVILAPKIMKKHRQNLSFYSIKDKQIHWCLEIQYLNTYYVTKPISQKTTILDAILQQDLFDSKLLDLYKINTSRDSLKCYFEEGKIQLNWQSYEVLDFTEQDEYKFKNQKKKLNQVNSHQKQTLFIDPNFTIEQMIKGYTVFEFPNIQMKFLFQNE